MCVVEEGTFFRNLEFLARQGGRVELGILQSFISRCKQWDNQGSDFNFRTWETPGPEEHHRKCKPLLVFDLQSWCYSGNYCWNVVFWQGGGVSVFRMRELDDLDWAALFLSPLEEGDWICKENYRSWQLCYSRLWSPTNASCQIIFIFVLVLCYIFGSFSALKLTAELVEDADLFCLNGFLAVSSAFYEILPILLSLLQTRPPWAVTKTPSEWGPPQAWGLFLSSTHFA